MNRIEYDFPLNGCQIKQEDPILEIVEGRLVPRDLSKFEKLYGDGDNSYLYIDDNGSPKKISYKELISGNVRSVNGLSGDIDLKEGKNISIKESNGEILISSPDTVSYEEYREHVDKFNSHIYNKNNPHEVSKALIGLGNVDNTSDMDKPLSSAAKLYIDDNDSRVAVEAESNLDNLSRDVYHKTDIKDIALSGKASDVNANAYGDMPEGTVQSCLEFLTRSIGTGGTGSAVIIDEEELEDKVLYKVKQGSVPVGTIDVPVIGAKQGSTIEVSVSNNKIGAEVKEGSIGANQLDNLTLEKLVQIETNKGNIENINIHLGDIDSALENKQSQIDDLDRSLNETKDHVMYIEDVLPLKQDQLTAGDNINIYLDSEGNNIIDSVDTIYDDTEVRGLIAGESSRAQEKESELNSLINQKQDKLSAGDNIEIDENNRISAIVPEVTTPEKIVVSREVGGYKVGDVIEMGTPLFNIIKQILQPEIPQGQTFLYWYTGKDIPTEITTSFEEEESNVSVVENGKVHFFSPAKDYIAFAYEKSMGSLMHVYMNDLVSFDIISDFSKKEVIYKGVTYNLYYTTEKLMGNNDKYEFLWR